MRGGFISRELSLAIPNEEGGRNGIPVRRIMPSPVRYVDGYRWYFEAFEMRAGRLSGKLVSGRSLGDANRPVGVSQPPLKKDYTTKRQVASSTLSSRAECL